MQKRTLAKRPHFEKRLIAMRASLIAVAEELRLTREKTAVADAAASEATSGATAIRVNLQAAREERTRTKEQIRERLKDRQSAKEQVVQKGGSKPGSRAVTPKATLSEVRTKQLADAVSVGLASVSAQEKAKAGASDRSRVWEQILSLTEAEGYEGVAEWWAAHKEARDVLDLNKEEMQARKDSLDQEQQTLLAEMNRLACEGDDADEESGLNRLKEVEWDLHKADERHDAAKERALEAERLHMSMSQLLDALLQRVSSGAAAPSRSFMQRASVVARSQVLKQQMLLDTLTDRSAQVAAMIATPPVAWLVPRSKPNGRHGSSELKVDPRGGRQRAGGGGGGGSDGFG